MMCAGFRRLKSWSLTKLTAWRAVSKLFAFEKTKGSRGRVIFIDKTLRREPSLAF